MPFPSPSVLLSLFSGFRNSVHQRIVRVNEVTERAVVRTGESLRAIVKGATEHVQRTEVLRKELLDHERGNLQEVLARQQRMVSAHNAEVCGLAGKQTRQTESALSLLDGINKAGKAIDDMAQASRLLALNALIEARRLGTAGTAFATIAGEMKAHAMQVAEAQQQVADLVDALRGSLPAIASQAREAETLATTFSREFDGNAAEVTLRIGELQHSVAEVLEAGATSIEMMIQHSHEALSALQFQDPTAQSLLELDAEAFDVEKSVAGQMQVPHADIRPAAISNLGGSRVVVDSAKSGEVLLF